MRELTPALGPYSHFKCYDSLVFASGQIPIDADGKVYSDVPIDVQTRLALENLSAVFEAAGASLEKALKVNIYLRCLDDFAAMNVTGVQTCALPIWCRGWLTASPSRSTASPICKKDIARRKRVNIHLKGENH